MIVRNEKNSISWEHERVEIRMIMLSEINPVWGDLKHLTRVQLLDISALYRAQSGSCTPNGQIDPLSPPDVSVSMGLFQGSRSRVD